MLDDGTNWLSISAGSWHLLALKRDGTLWICGESASAVAPGSASGPSATLVQVGSDSDWAEIHSGANSFVARKKDNSWWFCGSTDVGPSRINSPQRLPFDFEPIAIAAGESTVVFLAADGGLWSWGIRMGTKPRASLGVSIQRWLNKIDGRLFRWQLRSMNLGMPDDRRPHKIWTLPTEQERELRKSQVESGE
jgi:alpha-tubulin suppressor-like RCC1 family protein